MQFANRTYKVYIRTYTGLCPFVVQIEPPDKRNTDALFRNKACTIRKSMTVFRHINIFRGYDMSNLQASNDSFKYDDLKHAVETIDREIETLEILKTIWTETFQRHWICCRIPKAGLLLRGWESPDILPANGGDLCFNRNGFFLCTPGRSKPWRFRHDFR